MQPSAPRHFILTMLLAILAGIGITEARDRPVLRIGATHQSHLVEVSKIDWRFASRIGISQNEIRKRVEKKLNGGGWRVRSGSPTRLLVDLDIVRKPLTLEIDYIIRITVSPIKTGSAQNDAEEKPLWVGKRADIVHHRDFPARLDREIDQLMDQYLNPNWQAPE